MRNGLSCDRQMLISDEGLELKPKKPLMLLLVMILTLCVTGCELTPKNDYCMIATMPVYTDKDVDVISDELARWLDRHQQQYKAVCIDR